VISLDMPDADYRAVPALSYSGAKDLMRSPALFAHRLMHPRPDSTEFDVGHATHALLLGTGQPVARGYHPETGEPFKDWRTKDAKAFASAARARGETPLLVEQADAVWDMAGAVWAHPLAGKLLEPGRGHGEVSVFWDDTETCRAQRARLDWLLVEDDDGRPAVVDLKTTTDVTRAALVRTVQDYRYHWQHAHYLDGLAAHGVDDAVFKFVFVEKTPPHLVRVAELDVDFAAAGARFITAARRLYADCLAADDWPGYPPKVELLGLPRFAPTDPGDVIL
jgi:hypothetical protein